MHCSSCSGSAHDVRLCVWLMGAGGWRPTHPGPRWGAPALGPDPLRTAHPTGAEGQGRSVGVGGGLVPLARRPRRGFEMPGQEGAFGRPGHAVWVIPAPHCHQHSHRHRRQRSQSPPFNERASPLVHLLPRRISHGSASGQPASARCVTRPPNVLWPKPVR